MTSREEPDLVQEWQAFAREATLVPEPQDEHTRRLEHARRDVQRELPELHSGSIVYALDQALEA